VDVTPLMGGVDCRLRTPWSPLRRVEVKQGCLKGYRQNGRMGCEMSAEETCRRIVDRCIYRSFVNNEGNPAVR